MSITVLTFEEHIERLKLDLDVDPTVLKGPAAREFINKFGNRMTGNGGFDSKTNTVAVIDPERIGTLAHEMRHAWQYKNKETHNFDFSKPTSFLTYLVNRKEENANKYAMEYCKKLGLTKIANAYRFKLRTSLVMKFRKRQILPTY